MNDNEKRMHNEEAYQQRHDRLGKKLGAGLLHRLSATDSPWYETQDEIRDQLRWGRVKAQQLKWVRSQIVLRLTKMEGQCIRFYYFKGLTYREIAANLGTNVSTVHRTVRRGIRKLRRALELRGGKRR